MDNKSHTAPSKSYTDDDIKRLEKRDLKAELEVDILSRFRKNRQIKTSDLVQFIQDGSFEVKLAMTLLGIARSNFYSLVSDTL